MKTQQFCISALLAITISLALITPERLKSASASAPEKVLQIESDHTSGSKDGALSLGVKADSRIFAGNVITNSVLLAPVMSGNSPYDPWIFFTNEVIVNYSNGPVLLSSNPDGSGQINTDDAIHIEVHHPDGSVATYDHVYGYPACYGCVIPTDPVDLTTLFQVGTNNVRIDLYDNLPWFWFTWGYYLVSSGFTVAPKLDLPIDYTKFSVAALGNTGENPGRVNSWFDHASPDYGENITVTVWTGAVYTDTVIANLNSKNCHTGVNCYNGHNGIDFQHNGNIAEEPVYSAATGVITEIHRNWSNSNPGPRGKTYGNYVLIDHGGGYATFYAHLASVNPAIDIGTEITDTRAITVGIMGGTGSGPIHLHFGVYYDQNNDGHWTENEIVDPYGWNIFGLAGTAPDPWSAPSRYLWKYPLQSRQSVGSTGTSISSPSGNVTVTIPSGVLASPVTLELWDAPTASEPSAQLRSTGQSFWLRVLEWLSGNSTNQRSLSTPPSFSQPIEVTISYTDSQAQHLNEDLLTIRHWNDINHEWTVLTTTLNTTQNQVTAPTTEIGSFDLQGPLLCPADNQEPNDTYDPANYILPNGLPVTYLFDIPEDEDWFRLQTVAGGQYNIKTSNLATGVDTILQVYFIDGVSLLASDDNSGGGQRSYLEWQAPQGGIYFVRVVRASGGAYGCGASYELTVSQRLSLFLPLVMR